MTTNRRSAGGTAGRAPAPRSWARPPGLALLALAMIALAQGGCRSDGCSTCGFGSKITNGFNNGVAAVGRVFSHDKGGSGCKTCGGSGVEEGGFVEGMPYSAPGGMVVPAPGTIVPAPSIESAPSQLEVIPSTSTGTTGPASPASNRANTGNTRSAYEAYVPKAGVARRKGSELARALHSTPEVTTRPEQAIDSSNLFEKIPPVDLPAEVTRKASAPSPAPEAAPSPAPAPVTSNVAPTSAENHSAVEGAAGVSPAIPAVASSSPQAPGIRRSASVAPSIGGGSVPSIEGLEWLKEKGYKTFVDLRAGAEVEPTFADAVNDRGMVYISLPIVASRLDPNRLARFDDLVSQSANRPIYFCDTDGSRAGMVWYLHLRSVAGEGAETAVSKAEEVGLTPTQLTLADAYLVIHKPRPKVALAPSPKSDMAPEAPPAPPVATAAEVARNAEPTLPPDSVPASSELVEPPVQLPDSSDSPPLPKIPGEEEKLMTNSAVNLIRDTGSWRPLAALILSGLGIPLAYWSRSAISLAGSKVRRASLPAAARRSLEAPDASDA